MISSGSYKEDEVSFLLDVIPEVEAWNHGVGSRVENEFIPEGSYVDFFWRAVANYGDRIAEDVAKVARSLAQRQTGAITLVTLLRAGTPTGVLLTHALRHLGREVTHYSISAVRSQGVDFAALDLIRAVHPAESIVFVDGWTGKGFIAWELEEAVARYNQSRGDCINHELVVLSDLAGVAALAAGADDYPIAFSMMLGTICGLISGAFPNPREGRLNAVVSFDSLHDCDLTRVFIDEMMLRVRPALDYSTALCDWSAENRSKAASTSQQFVEMCTSRFGVDRNSVKPGICEVNRALLTRSTAMTLLIQEEELIEKELTHILWLIENKEVTIKVCPEMPYRAAILLTN